MLTAQEKGEKDYGKCKFQGRGAKPMKVELQLTQKTSINNLDFADKANDIVLIAKSKGRESWFNGLSTSKLRGIYAYITNVYTRINKPEDFEKYKSDIQYLKAKMAYECGRNNIVKSFITKTGLMDALNCIETYDQFILYCRYAESLVAYFKFHGGKE